MKKAETEEEVEEKPDAPKATPFHVNRALRRRLVKLSKMFLGVATAGHTKKTKRERARKKRKK